MTDLLKILALLAAGLVLRLALGGHLRDLKSIQSLWAGIASPPLVVLRVVCTWPTKVRLVLSELNLYEGLEGSRVVMDLLHLSRGSLEDLRRWVKMANNDYREVIAAAEYPRSEIGAEVLREFREWKPPENEAEVSFKDLLP